MKNTEYKDVFDFSEEALSMGNKFSAPSFPSFKNAFTLGENIRGMTNVSPLATVKFFNQTPDDLLTKYYPDSGPVVEGSFAVVQDIGSDPEPVITKTVKDFYYYGVEEVNNFAFRVILFSSTDATKLKESFEVSAPSGREILMFVEDNRSDKASGTYGAIKISADVLSFLNKSGRLDYDLYNNREVYTEIKKVIPELEDDQIKSLLQKGYIEDIRVGIAKTYFKLASFFSSGLSFINPGLGILTNDAMRAATSILLEKVILLIEKTKLDENRWQPKPPKLENGEPDESYSYQPLISTGSDSNGSVNFSEITGLLKNMLKEQNDTVRLALNVKKDFRKNGQPKGFLELLYNLYLSAYDIMYDVITGLDQMADLDILKYGARTFNALVCGVWNGLVDSVAGLFAMVKMIYDGITLGKDFAQNIEEYLPVLLEQFDEAVQAIRNISFTETARYIYGKLKEINLTFDPVACAYFTGYAFGFIISLVIEIIVGALVSGGVLDIPIIIEKLEEAIFGIFRLGWGMAKGAAKKVRTFSRFVVKSVKDLIKDFQELLNFLKKGWNEFKNIIDDAFKKSVKILDEQASIFIKKLPSNIGKFVDLLTQNFPKLQKKIVDGLLVIEFKGNILAKINPKGIITEIKYFRELNNYTYFTELKNVKIELEITDNLGRKNIRKYEDTVEVMRKGDDVAFRAKFDEGKVRDGEYINYTYEKSNSNPPYATNPKSKSKVIDKFLKDGDEFYIVENKSQIAPGSFLTDKPIYTIKDLREKLAVLESWKFPQSGNPLVIRKYKVLKEFQVRDGWIGPMEETTKGSTNFGRIYKGGNQQYESLRRFTRDDVFIPSKDASNIGRILEQIESFEKIIN